MIGASLTLHFNKNVYITLIVYDKVLRSDQERLHFVLLVFREQMLCPQFNS